MDMGCTLSLLTLQEGLQVWGPGLTHWYCTKQGLRGSKEDIALVVFFFPFFPSCLPLFPFLLPLLLPSFLHFKSNISWQTPELNKENILLTLIFGDNLVHSVCCSKLLSYSMFYGASPYVMKNK